MRRWPSPIPQGGGLKINNVFLPKWAVDFSWLIFSILIIFSYRILILRRERWYARHSGLLHIITEPRWWSVLPGLWVCVERRECAWSGGSVQEGGARLADVMTDAPLSPFVLFPFPLPKPWSCRPLGSVSTEHTLFVDSPPHVACIYL